MVRLEVKPCTPEQSVPPGAGRDPDVVVPDGASLPRFQRVGAYALVRSRRGLLATRHSGRTNRPGTWGLPGGGVEPGEDPRAAAVRECWEETAQRVDLGSLALVQTAHWIGRAPSGRVEDFHAVRLVYHGQCPAPTSPDVLDAEGTTAAAAWVPSDQVGQVRWAAPAREQLMRLGLLPAS